MTHKFAVIVDKKFYNQIQNNSDFYLRVLVLDVIRALIPNEESADKYSSDIFYKCAKSISNAVRMFEDEKSIIFYLELSSVYLDDFFEKPLDDFE
jgi:hypothetical protein